MKRDEIVRHCDRLINETAALRKHLTKYKQMRKWMNKIFRKFDNRGIKIVGVNSIRITKYLNSL